MEKESVNLNTKTHRRLRRAYCHLVKDGKKVNVSTLTDEADISRATFYLYYKDIEEFENITLEYLIRLFVNQICVFIKGTRSEVKEKCRKKNLFFTDDDFELFRCIFFESGFSFNQKEFGLMFDNFNENISDYFTDRFIKKNKHRFEIFFIGYGAVMRDNFFDYHSDKVAADVLRTMNVWDYFFPDKKFKD